MSWDCMSKNHQRALGGTSSELESSNVTLLLSQTGLDDSVLLLVVSPGWPATKVVDAGWCHLWLLVCLLLLDLLCCLLLDHLWLPVLPMADRAVQADDVALQQGGHHQCLMVGIPGYPQGLLS